MFAFERRRLNCCGTPEKATLSSVTRPGTNVEGEQVGLFWTKLMEQDGARLCCSADRQHYAWLSLLQHKIELQLALQNASKRKFGVKAVLCQ